MEVIRGTSRIAIVGSTYTVKVPNINFYTLTRIFQILTKKGLKHRVGKLKNEFKGWYDKTSDNILANTREYRLGKQYPEIVMKTRLSLFGILNIQETGIPISDKEKADLWRKMIDGCINPNNMKIEGHTFYDGNNFARDRNGKVRLIDAGSYTMPATLKIESKSIQNAIQSF